MRTSEEITEKVAILQKQIDTNIGTKYILNIQIDILLGDDSSENYEDSEDSWLHQGAEAANEWLLGDDDIDF